MTDEITLEALKERAASLDQLESQLSGDMRTLLVGPKARIIDPSYNGQPYGRSRKPLTGRVLTIAWTLRWGKSIGVGFKEFNDGCKIEGVELL